MFCKVVSGFDRFAVVSRTVDMRLMLDSGVRDVPLAVGLEGDRQCSTGLVNEALTATVQTGRRLNIRCVPGLADLALLARFSDWAE